MSTSTGRGGAGNMSSTDAVARTETKDLVTPHIKQQIYTTGRGGTGNMATNLKEAPEMARAAQDVHAPPVRRSDAAAAAAAGGGGAPGEGAKKHVGRGGGGNFQRAGSTEAGDAAARDKVREGGGPRRASMNVVEGGRKLLAQLRGEKKEREGEGGGAAVE